MIKFSVIVPAYNVERYLPKCIESIINQTYSDLEIILVNDGSPDGCLEIMQQYAKQDRRIVVVSQENGGLSAARNAGLRVATGDYVSFIDSDDWVEPDMFSVLAAHLSGASPDYACFRLRFDSEKTGKGTVYGSPYPIEALVGRDAILEDTLKVQHIPTSACSKVYNRTFLSGNNLFFEPGIVNEDTLFSIQAACCANKVTFVNRVLYHTIERDGSISRASYERLCKHMVIALDKAKEYMVDKGLFEKFEALYKARYLKSILYNLLQMAQRLPYKEYRRIWGWNMEYSQYKEYNKAFIRAKLPLQHQCMLLFAAYPWLLYGTMKVLNKFYFKMH